MKFLSDLIDQILPLIAIIFCVFVFGFQQVAHLKLVVKVNEQSETIARLEQVNRDTHTKFDSLAADFVTLSKLPADSKIEFSNFKMNEKLLQTSDDLNKLKSSIVDSPEEILALYKLKSETQSSLKSLAEGQKHVESLMNTRVDSLKDQMNLILALGAMLFTLMLASIAANFKSSRRESKA
ncbi:hypothetical protein M2F98_21230 [Vibrio vulnificus]|nr:hypothetical protein [Vibrio vulnificus]